MASRHQHRGLDHHVITLEIEQIAQRLSDGDAVLDVGCASGYSSVQFAAARKIRVRGLDYIPEMIAARTLAGGQIRRSIVGLDRIRRRRYHRLE